MPNARRRERSALEAADHSVSRRGARSRRRQRDDPAAGARCRSGARAGLGVRARSRSRSATTSRSTGSPPSAPRVDPACAFASTPTARGTSDSAMPMLARLAVYDIELVEDPVASLEELAALRRPCRDSRLPRSRASGPPHDARRLRQLDAADAIVLKPQRIGGVREALRAADAESGVPAIASSALETSVGLAAVVALAASLPDAPFAHGAGTGLLLASDVVDDPLIPIDGWLTPRTPVRRHERAASRMTDPADGDIALSCVTASARRAGARRRRAHVHDAGIAVDADRACGSATSRHHPARAHRRALVGILRSRHRCCIRTTRRDVLHVRHGCGQSPAGRGGGIHGARADHRA